MEQNRAGEHPSSHGHSNGYKEGCSSCTEDPQARRAIASKGIYRRKVKEVNRRKVVNEYTRR